MSINSSSRAGKLAASALLICLLFSNASAFAMAATGGPGAGAAGAAGGAGTGNGGPPAAAVLPSDTDRIPYWHYPKVQKARGACPIQFPRCRQNELD
jgi:hypothetical protein